MKQSATTMYMFRTVTLRPHWMQYIINNVPAFCILLASFWLYAWPCYDSFVVREIVLGINLFTLMFLMFKLIYFARMEYVITREQIILMHGVLSHSTDYVELYRVVDYAQHRSLPQQLFNLKTVSIYSGDRNNSVVNIIGIKNDLDIIAEIRTRVEFNKHNKGIYEITNR